MVPNSTAWQDSKILICFELFLLVVYNSMNPRHDDMNKVSAAVVVLILCMISAGSAGAYDPEQLEELLETKKCLDCDLSSADLSDEDLSEADLFLCNLSDANLSGADLTEAKLTGANLSEANMTEAQIIDAVFVGASMYDTVWVDGEKCNDTSIGECSRVADHLK